MPMITPAQIEDARNAISGHVHVTPCIKSDMLSDLLGAKVHLKLENMQRTGSFKERGALNRLLLLDPKERLRGVATASAGNHAQAVAFHATRLGIKSTIFMPIGTPILKANRTEQYGANITLCGENFDEAHEAAHQYAQEHNIVFIHPYDDGGVIAGQGTAGLEICDQMDQLDAIIVAVGGGGLMAGIATAVLNQRPDVRMIGVEPQSLPSMAQAIAHRAPYALPKAQTLADGIKVRRVGDLTYRICEKLVKEWITVNDTEIARAILFLMENQKVVAEGAGAAGVAALLSGAVKDIKGKSICVVIGGGNIDVTLVARVIERGLVESSRVIQLKVMIADKPGELAKLLNLVSEQGANVLEVHHERAFAQTNWDEVMVDLILETRGAKNVQGLLSHLTSYGYKLA